MAKERDRWLPLLRWLAAGLAGLATFSSVLLFLSDKMCLRQMETLPVPHDGLSLVWFEEKERTHSYRVSFGETELYRDDNLDGRDTRDAIRRTVTLLDWMRFLVPLASGVLVGGAVNVFWRPMCQPRRGDGE